jgi:hypothetical protein
MNESTRTATLAAHSNGRSVDPTGSRYRRRKAFRAHAGTRAPAHDRGSGRIGG